MNKKQLFIAAVAAVLSVSSVSATDITGVTGVNGVYNIEAQKTNGDVAFRQYNNFNLSEGDIANLMYKYGTKDIETFINLVNNGVNINGILNTVRDGNFYNGHAVFITPGGMAIGASGVLNVGSLSVSTPTQSAYDALKGEYAAGTYDNIMNVSKLLNKGSNVGNITVDGKILSRNGVQLRGGQIDVGVNGAILNGITEQKALTSATQAENLFNSLVNTDGLMNASAFTTNGSNIQIKSTTGVNVAGKVLNGAADASGINAAQGNSGVFITNKGANGTKISGVVQSSHELNVYNQAGDLNISGKVKNEGTNLNISNKGANLTVGGTLSTDRDLAVTNRGTGALTISGTAAADGKVDVDNYGAGGMNITGAVTGSPKVRFVNVNGKLVISNNADKIASEKVEIVNHGNGGMSLAGVKSENGIYAVNHAGNLTVNGKLSATEEGSMIDLRNNATAGKLDIANGANIVANGKLSVRNMSNSGLTIAKGAEITNASVGKVETAITNKAGNMYIDGNIANEGDMTIKTEGGTGLTIADNANITNIGRLKIKNDGANGMTVSGKVTNEGNLTIYNNAGTLTLADKANGTEGATINNQDGNLYIWSRENSKGISTSANSSLRNEGAGYNIAIRHDGTTTAGQNGMNLNGAINSEGQVAVNNYSGNMVVGGNIEADGDIGVINRAGGGSMELTQGGTVNGGNINIKNFGSSDLTVNNEISHTGRLNVLANTNKLKLNGTVNNNSNGNLDGNNGFYAASRKDGTGIEVGENFNANGGGQNLIKNISGNEGLTYKGNVNASGSQTELYNQKGDMTVNGAITNNGGNIVVLNKGDKMTVDSAITTNKEAKVVNKGSVKATVNESKIQSSNTKKFYEQLKK